MLHVLYISYALPHCTTEMVRHKFDSMSNICYVTHVAEQFVDDTKNVGKKFKRFWIQLEADRGDQTLEYVLETIQKDGFAKVYYEKTKGIDRFWKVKRVDAAPFDFNV